MFADWDARGGRGMVFKGTASSRQLLFRGLLNHFSSCKLLRRGCMTDCTLSLVVVSASACNNVKCCKLWSLLPVLC